jgi:GNAT superfamily N-acetyltransferase
VTLRLTPSVMGFEVRHDPAPLLTIRKVNGADHAADIGELHSICFSQNEHIPDPASGQWWLTFDDDEPIAFAHLLPSTWYDNAGYLSRSGVIPKYRGYGLQKRLIRARVTQARRNGWEWLRTDTRGNPASSNSLISCGFRLFEPKHPWAFSDSLYFVMRL